MLGGPSCSRFRAARNITYTADLDTGSTFGVTVEWKGSSTSDPKSAATQVPRDFSASFPAFASVWPLGKEQKHVAKFRLRVIASPSTSDAQPLFRVLWVNAAEYEAEAIAALRTHVAATLAREVFVATPSIQRYLLLPGMTPA